MALGGLLKKSYNFSSLRSLSRCCQERSRKFGSSASGPGVRRSWRNETPAGGLTELYVYTPDSMTVWPDPNLGVFSAKDPRFPLPGNVGSSLNALNSSQSQVEKPVPSSSSSASGSGSSSRDTSKITTTNQERQAQVLYSATDYIKFSTEAEAELCHGILDKFPEFPGMKTLKCEIHEAPTLLKKQVQDLFPYLTNIGEKSLSCVTLSQKTVNDMSAYSEEMEAERELLIDDFVAIAKDVTARLKEEGYWADFIDPCSGTPYYGGHTPTTMFETDEKYRLLGFRIEDLGCCKVISHKDFGTNVFVGVIFTDAHVSQGVIQDTFQDLGVDDL